jgi:hypothetical protein
MDLVQGDLTGEVNAGSELDGTDFHKEFRRC